MTHIPSRSPIVRLSSIVPTLSMSAQKENLILNIFARLLIQLQNLMVESLPLSQGGNVLEL